MRLTSQFTELALSPAGKKVAFVARGDVFAASTRDGGDAERVTATPRREFDLTWTPDSRKAIFATDREGKTALAMFDFGSRTETVLTTGAADDHAPVVSPDGSEVAYLRGRGELRAISLATKQDRLLASADLPSSLDASRAAARSPDGKWIAYLALGVRSFTNVRLVPSAGGGSRPVSFLSNFGADSLAWSPDGTFLTFATGQRTEDGEIARVDLVLRTPKFREDQFRSLFEQQSPARPKPSPASPTPPANPASPNLTTEKGVLYRDWVELAGTGRASEQRPAQIRAHARHERAVAQPVVRRSRRSRR